MNMNNNYQENGSNVLHTYLSFQLGKETFAANVGNVLNILEMKPITQVPKAPEYLKGVINLRGNVLPVVDLRLKFGMPPIQITKDTCILVLQININDESVTLGAMVDSVEEVLEIEDDKIEAAPSIGTKYKADFIKGMWRVEEEFIMLLNIDLIFSSDDLVVLSDAKNNEVKKEATIE